MPREGCYPIAKLVLHQELQGAGLEQLLGLHGGLVGLEALIENLAQDVLELVVGPQVLLGPLGQGIGVDATLESSSGEMSSREQALRTYR